MDLRDTDVYFAKKHHFYGKIKKKCIFCFITFYSGHKYTMNV